MAEMTINKNDEVVMKLLHYFITEQGYNPIVLHGAKDEIWLENLNNPYKIVRIVTNYIHNDEQFDFDIFKTRQIVKKISRKTLTFKIKALSIFLNLGENVNINNYNEESDIKVVNINDIKDLKKYDFITSKFPNITKKTSFKEKGVKLFMKLTGDINKKSEQDAALAENVFKTKKPTITYALIIINVLMFLAMYLFGNGSTDIQTLINFGATVDVLIKQGELFRLLTSAFLHIGILHLALNMYALYIIGPQIESFLGKTKFITIYLFSAITGNLLSMVFANNTIGAGASGAIFGLLGSLLYFGYHYRVYLGGVLRSQIIPLIALNLLLGFIMPGIDNAAHVGGLIGGILITMALGIKYKSSKSEQINGLVLTLIFTSFLIYMAFIIA